MFLLVFFQIFDGFVDVLLLRAFITRTQEQYNSLPDNGVIHPVSWAVFDDKFPDSFSTRLLLTEMSFFNAVKPSVYSRLTSFVLESLEPILGNVLTVFHVMYNVVMFRHVN